MLDLPAVCALATQAGACSGDWRCSGAGGGRADTGTHTYDLLTAAVRSAAGNVGTQARIHTKIITDAHMRAHTHKRTHTHIYTHAGDLLKTALL